MDKKTYSIVIINIIFILFSIFLWTRIGIFLKEPFFWMEFSNNSFVPILLLIFALTLIMSLLGLVSVTRISAFTQLPSLLIGSASILFFYPLSLSLFLMTIAYFVSCFIFLISSQKGVNNYVRISFWETLHAPLGKLLFTLILTISIGYYQSALLKVDSYKFRMPDQFSEQFINMLIQGNPNLANRPDTNQNSLFS